MTPGFLLSGPLNIYLPTQNPAAFTTILCTPHKHMAYHNTIPNTATHVLLHTTKHIGKHTHSSYTILLPPNPKQLHSIDRSDADNMMEPRNLLWRSLHHPTTAQHTNALTLRLIILVYVLNGSLVEPNNIFLYNLCQYVIFTFG